MQRYRGFVIKDAVALAELNEVSPRIGEGV